ncbi:ATP-dependent helicase HrpB [Paenibacillus sp. FJAT-26967]|uniref:ATP-dependent helicase HrpB n=1 Tax=Paenibacillus sp. FJAT-26967 TaxID=1729690 RepID=UPI000838684B|nr:ATP-dependent helicase HrpB [Paenibacillus sp. FJAT-26967]
MPLPIETILPELKKTLQERSCAVLTAEPGAGKTTLVPLALLDEPWLMNKRIVMLEPRRLAARSAAGYMSSSLGDKVGGIVGYRMRSDTRVGPDTRIEVITEGILTRMLQHDPGLEQVGIVIFDEFHERSLHADLGLALCLQAQSLLRDDLRILIMSATLDADAVSILLEDAPVLSSTGRSYPVETRYLTQPAKGRIENEAVKAILSAWADEEGDMLVFLPGAPEIRRAARELKANLSEADAAVLPLYGSLSQEAQDKAIEPDRAGRRKIVLATTIAETSLTVGGIRIVIDCGLTRVSKFSPRTGMSRLETVPVSRASADQRRGRAGRLQPGVCYRLWTELEESRLAPSSSPEIAEADLAPLALELAAWGAQPEELRWLDLPPKAAYQQACSLLRQLGALDACGAITPHGRRMAELGLHPRLAHMALRALELGAGGLACEVAVLLGERDILRSTPEGRDADLRLRVEALRSAGGAQRESRPAESGDQPGRNRLPGLTAGGGGAQDEAAEERTAGTSRADAASVSRLHAEAARWKRELGVPRSEVADAALTGLLLAFAFPDRIARQRSTGRYLLSSGRGAAFPDMQRLSAAPWLVCAELDDQGAESRIYLAAPVELEELENHLAEAIETEIRTVWDREAQAVRSRRKVMLGSVTLREGMLTRQDPEQVLTALLQGIRLEGLAILPWSRTSRQLQQRLQFMASADKEWPEVRDDRLLCTLQDWLAPHLYGMKSKNDLQRLNLTDILGSMLSWEKRRRLDEEAPTHYTVPSGSRIPIDYSNAAAPFASVRLQELFGLSRTPGLCGGRVPLTLHLLSPAQRPVQITRDLESFWQNTYFEVKKDLKGRYPKHYWPDNPLEAAPTNRVKPRKPSP